MCLTSLETNAVQSTVLLPCAQTGDGIPLVFVEITWLSLKVCPWRAETPTSTLECQAHLFRCMLGTYPVPGRNGFP